MNMASLGNLGRTKVNELGLVPADNKIVSISSTDMTLEGFRKMVREQVQAVAVIDEEGKLVGNLSASDVRGLSSEKVKLVSSPFAEYIKQLTGAPFFYPVTC